MPQPQDGTVSVTGSTYAGNALYEMSREAMDLLKAADQDYVLAIEVAARAARVRRETAEEYNGITAEVEGEYMFGEAGSHSNAEKRKAALAVAMEHERKNGRLVAVTARMRAAEGAYEDAQMAQEQAKVRFRTATAYADIVSNLVRALG